MLNDMFEYDVTTRNKIIFPKNVKRKNELKKKKRNSFK